MFFSHILTRGWRSHPLFLLCDFVAPIKITPWLVTCFLFHARRIAVLQGWLVPSSRCPPRPGFCFLSPLPTHMYFYPTLTKSVGIGIINAGIRRIRFSVILLSRGFLPRSSAFLYLIFDVQWFNLSMEVRYRFQAKCQAYDYTKYFSCIFLPVYLSTYT